MMNQPLTPAEFGIVKLLKEGAYIERNAAGAYVLVMGITPQNRIGASLMSNLITKKLIKKTVSGDNFARFAYLGE
jgi:hypothetical protein